MLRKIATLPLALAVFAACADSPTEATQPDIRQDIRPVLDIVGNRLDASLDAVAEVMPLVIGGANGTTTLYVDPKNGDGKNGCNFGAGGSPTLVVSASSSDPTVATVSPSSITLTGCGDQPALTVTPVGVGSATISLTQVSNTTSGSFQLDEATFTVNVSAPPNTAPQLSIVGVTGGASYAKGAMPAATCNVTDAEDGNSSFAATLSAITGPYASDGIGQQTASCEYTDGGGLIVRSSVSYDIIDPSAPVIGPALDPASPDGANGWYTSDVTLTWSVGEPESPNSLQKTGCEDQSITADQAETTYSCAAKSAGGEAVPREVTIKRDATAPVLSVSGGPDDGGSYYFGSVPEEPDCTASDALSGLDGICDVTGHGTAVGAHTINVSAKDQAGNVTSTSVTYEVKAWTISGFYNPVDMGGVVNTVKGGSTVPLKFEVFAGSELTSTSAVRGFRTAEVNCTSLAAATVEEVEFTTTGGTSLRYDATAGQFIQNWQTPKTSGKCYRATLTTLDGSSISALFKTR